MCMYSIMLLGNRRPPQKPNILSCPRKAGNYAKRCALMHWSFFLLNDDTTCHIWGVNDRNTARTEFWSQCHILVLGTTYVWLKYGLLLRDRHHFGQNIAYCCGVGVILDIFWRMSKFEAYDLNNSLKYSFSGVGSIKKRFLMVESCLEHSSKLSLVRKIIFWGITSQRNIRIEAEKSCFLNGWLETMPKDAPWCTDHFSYWMTTPRVIFGG